MTAPLALARLILAAAATLALGLALTVALSFLAVLFAFVTMAPPTGVA